MKNRKSRKPGTGYWQQREWRRRSWRRRMRDPIRLILVGVFIGGALGSFLFSGGARILTSTELSGLWDRYKPSAIGESRSAGVPARWEDRHRRAPDAESPSGEAPARARTQEVTVRFSVCSSRIRVNCVVDGDTLWYRGQKIRIADINTPEISSPKCSYEEGLGHKAKHRLVELLNAGPFQVVRRSDRDRDRYNRLLRLIVRNGESLGMILVHEGLAHVWDGSKHPWCR